MSSGSRNEEEIIVDSDNSVRNTNPFLKLLADNLIVILAVVAVVFVLYFALCSSSEQSHGPSDADGKTAVVIEVPDTITVYPPLISFAQNLAELNVYEAYVFSQIDKSFWATGERYEYTFIIVGRVVYSINIENIAENEGFFVDSINKVITIHIDGVDVSSCEPLLDRSRVIAHADVRLTAQEAFDDAFRSIELAKTAMIRQADIWGVRESARINAEILLDRLYNPLGYSVDIVWHDNAAVSRNESSSSSSRVRR